MNRLFRAALYFTLITATVAVSAENWPSRPVKLIVPTGPGSAIDVMGRLMADGVSHAIGQPVFVENIPSAAGILAHETAARAAPDGYTLLFTNTSGVGINPITFKQLPYDPIHDFAAVATVCNLAPQLLSVSTSLPVTSVSDLAAYAKRNPGKLSIAFDNTAGAAAFEAKLFNKRAGLGLIEVPYRSSAQMTQDVAGGVEQIMMSGIVVANALVQAGKLRQLAVTSGRRFPGLPDVPTVNETLPGVEMNGLFAIVTPSGTPQDIIQKLNKAIGQFLDRSDVQKRMLMFGVATEGAGTPESTEQAIRKEHEDWQKVADELHIKPQ